VKKSKFRTNHFGVDVMLKSFKSVIAEAKKRKGNKIVVAGAEGKAVLEALKIAHEDEIVEPILVGNKSKIETIAEEVGFNLKDVELYDMSNEQDIAEKAVELVHSKHADGLMKGKVSTPALLKAVLDKRFDLRTDRLLSHIAILEIPAYHKFLLVTDGGMVIQPTLEQKVGIIKNAAEVMQKLGVEKPKVAVLAAIEKVNPNMPETEDAEILTEMARKGELGNVEVEGPLAVDIALSPEAARLKGVESRISGDPDIFLVPNIACGNIFAKGVWHLANAKIGGLVVGARKSIILLSRSDDAETKLNSIALGVVTS